MPIHIIRDVALTIRSFHKRITDFVRYRQATRDMNSRYPDATSEEVNREDCCIICREDMRAWPPQPTAVARPGGNSGNSTERDLVDERLRPKKLPCGHVLHFACLRSWLERQQNCPTCRAPVLVPHATTQSQTQQVPNHEARAHPDPGLPHNQVPGHVDGQPAMPVQNVYQLGPFRVAFGVRNIVQGVPRQAEQHQPDRDIAGVNTARLRDPVRPPGETGPAQTRTIANFSPSSPSTQLQHIEQQLLREISSLRLQADQLSSVRALQNELSRLRTLEASLNTSPLAFGPSNQYRPTPSFFLAGQSTQSSPVFTSNLINQSLGSGDENLPNGMTIPEGWTVLPLRRVPNASEPSQSNLPSIHQSLSRSSAQDASDFDQAGSLNTPETPVLKEMTSVGGPTHITEPARSTVNNRESKAEKQSAEPRFPEATSSEGTNGKRGLESAETTKHQMQQRLEQQHASTQPGRHDKGKSRAATVEDSAEDVD